MADLESIELELLLEGVFRHYGRDFRQYARSSLRRRVWNMVEEEKLRSISELQARVLHDTDAMERLLLHMSVNVTTMFRDPSFWSAFRTKVVPLLRSFPFVRVWHAACASGEEVYSMAVLLAEEGLYDRSRIYATDMNAEAVERAKSGIYPLSQMQEFTQNYVQGGGKTAFSEYYTANYDRVIFKAALRKNMVFAQHTLGTDGSFNEFNVVLCRNALIYFDADLQARAHRTLFSSLARFGVFSTGNRETVDRTPHEQDYEPVDDQEKIYRRIR